MMMWHNVLILGPMTMLQHCQCPPGIWVGYADCHPNDRYQGFNPMTKMIILTQNLTSLQKPCGNYSMVENPVLVTTHYEGSDDVEELKVFSVVN